MNRRGIALSLAILLASAVARADAPAPEPAPARAPHAVRLAVSGLFVTTTTSKGDATGTFSEQNGGNAVAASLGYKSPYGVGAFVDLGFYPLYRRDRLADLGAAGGLATTRASVSTTGLVFGASFDFWRLRGAAGVGSFSVAVRSTTLGITDRVSEGDLGYLVSVSGFPVRWGRLEIGIEARAAFVIEAELTTVGIGFTFGGDAIRW